MLDLHNRLYTVFYFAKPKVTIKFDLTEEENNRIIENYYSLRLHKLSKQIDFRDKCMIDPTKYYYINVKSKSFDQEIKIASCDRFYLFGLNKAKRVKEFIQIIEDIIELKPEIKNIPKSDIPSM